MSLPSPARRLLRRPRCAAACLVAAAVFLLAGCAGTSALRLTPAEEAELLGPRVVMADDPFVRWSPSAAPQAATQLRARALVLEFAPGAPLRDASGQAAARDGRARFVVPAAAPAGGLPARCEAVMIDHQGEQWARLVAQDGEGRLWWVEVERTAADAEASAAEGSEGSAPGTAPAPSEVRVAATLLDDGAPLETLVWGARAGDRLVVALEPHDQPPRLRFLALGQRRGGAWRRLVARTLVGPHRPVAASPDLGFVTLRTQDGLLTTRPESQRIDRFEGDALAFDPAGTRWLLAEAGARGTTLSLVTLGADGPLTKELGRVPGGATPFAATLDAASGRVLLLGTTSGALSFASGKGAAWGAALVGLDLAGGAMELLWQAEPGEAGRPARAPVAFR